MQADGGHAAEQHQGGSGQRDVSRTFGALHALQLVPQFLASRAQALQRVSGHRQLIAFQLLPAFDEAFILAGNLFKGDASAREQAGFHLLHKGEKAFERAVKVALLFIGGPFLLMELGQVRQGGFLRSIGGRETMLLEHGVDDAQHLSQLPPSALGLELLHGGEHVRHAGLGLPAAERLADVLPLLKDIQAFQLGWRSGGLDVLRERGDAFFVIRLQRLTQQVDFFLQRLVLQTLEFLAGIVVLRVELENGFDDAQRLRVIA